MIRSVHRRLSILPTSLHRFGRWARYPELRLTESFEKNCTDYTVLSSIYGFEQVQDGSSEIWGSTRKVRHTGALELEHRRALPRRSTGY